MIQTVPVVHLTIDINLGVGYLREIMALLSQAIKEKEFDIRTIERDLSKGLTSAEVIEKTNQTLPDDQEFALTVSVDELFESIKGRSSLRRSL